MQALGGNEENVKKKKIKIKRLFQESKIDN